ncbi:hypothetical protein [Collinsella sp. An2]|uniref:hypothetical protein n=1 Tax=Collinsella sp. An2 TaxID=1965585 RepID=UPI000B37E0AD|nr:hypothetical protein [Collinsella sp. An2]OUP07430.1 hypothetical protein B5F33_08770 [Collinsella sp. An2]
MRRGFRHGIDLFIEDGAYTTLAAAVSILVVLALVFSASTAMWSMSRAGDTQVVADTTALAGANVVSSYHTTATVVDAAVLSMGLAGLCVTGAGLVGLLVPGANALAAETVQAGIRMIDARNSFATSASRGLKTLEESLPYLVAANGTRTCTAQETENLSFVGTALAVPRESASEFPALEGDQVPTERLEQEAWALDEVAQELAEASEDTARSKEAAWLADCGRDGRNMQERAAQLSGLSGAENPDYASSITWEPTVGLDRARAYYRWRLDNEAPEGSGVEAQADSAARRAFYRFALEQMERASIVEEGGRVVSTVPLLPRNTDEVRATELYTEAVWPSSVEDDGLTLHYASSCPGASGAAGPAIALSAIDAGAARECEVCRFSVGDLGKTPAASTSIDNGFEYHLREFTQALDEYVDCRNRELELERAALGQAEDAGDSFEEALSVLAGKRPRIAPPGREGCLALVSSGEISSPAELESSFAAGTELGRRGAIAAAVLAPDAATSENNVLSQFFSSLKARTGGGGAVGLIDDVMGLWGELLLGYGDLAAGLSSLMDDLVGGLSTFGMGPIASWLGERVEGAVRGLGFEPVDLSVRKPVLTDSGNVLARAGLPGASAAQDLLRSLTIGTTDPAAIARAIGYELGEYVASATITLAEIPLPGGGSLPLTVRLRDVIAPLTGG